MRKFVCEFKLKICIVKNSLETFRNEKIFKFVVIETGDYRELHNIQALVCTRQHRDHPQPFNLLCFVT